MTRRTTILAALAAAVLVGLGTALGLLIATGDESSAPTVDRTSPRAVVTAFITRYATGNPSACALVTAEVRAEMREEGRCHGQPHGTTPSIHYQRTAICPPASASSSMFYARVRPPGNFGKPYAMIFVQHSNGRWTVNGVRTWTTPLQGTLGQCQPADTKYGG